MTAVSRPAPIVKPPLDFDHYRRAAFPLVIRYHREQCGLSPSLVADLTGLTLQAVRDIEDGKDIPTLDTVFALADVLGTDAAELLHETRAVAENLLVDRWSARRNRAQSIAGTVDLTVFPA